MFEQFISKQNDREAVFHAPHSRLVLLPFAALFAFSDVYVLITPPLPNGLQAWIMFIILALFATAMTVILTVGCLPAELHLDFAQRTYKARIGIIPLLIQRFGSFDDFQCVFIEQNLGGVSGSHIYRIGIAWKRGTRSLMSSIDHYHLSPFDRCYRFVVTRNQEAAIKYAEDIASQVGVPYFGLLPTGSKLPDPI